MSLDAFEETINEISDQDRNWWPFLWLRPVKAERLTLTRLVALAILYGVPLGGLATLGLAAARPEMRDTAYVLVAVFPLVYLLFASVVIGPMWNRRAERLRARAVIAPR